MGLQPPQLPQPPQPPQPPQLPQRQQLANDRLAPLALELCDMAATVDAVKTEVENLQRDVKRQRVQPAGRIPGMDRMVVRFNIGGMQFESNPEALEAGSAWFSLLLSGRFPVPLDVDGAIFIDRDGTHFRVVLDFLELGLPSLHKHLVVMSRSQRRELL